MSSLPDPTLSPELEAILDKIGWAEVKKRDPSYAANCAQRLTPDAGGWAPDPVEARKTLQRFKRLTSDIERVQAQLNTLNSKEANHLNSLCHPIDPGNILDPNRPDYIQTARDALDSLVRGLKEPSSWFTYEVSQGRKGRPRNEVAYYVARILSYIYVVGRGEKPSYGRDAITGAPNGDFAPVVAEVFEALGLQVKDPVDFCEAACKELTEAWLDWFRIIRNGSDPEDIKGWEEDWGWASLK